MDTSHSHTGRRRTSSSMSVSQLLQSAELVRLGAKAAGGGGRRELGFDALRGKIVAIYFSASWCPPCRAFTPKLVEFYNQAHKEAGLEVVWCSSDDDAQQFQAYAAKMGPWLAVPFEDVELRTRLKQELGVCAGKEQAAVGVKDRRRGIPTLAVVRRDGSVVTLEGDEQVEKEGLVALKKWAP